MPGRFCIFGASAYKTRANAGFLLIYRVCPHQILTMARTISGMKRGFGPYMVHDVTARTAQTG
jgi:hypothetical protein